MVNAYLVFADIEKVRLFVTSRLDHIEIFRACHNKLINSDVAWELDVLAELVYGEDGVTPHKLLTELDWSGPGMVDGLLFSSGMCP